ncbi:MAG: peptidase M23, partial [Lachnospiraceae bacterium]|nr:peptidase M23 [Lachnospiraceae bacterium]
MKRIRRILCVALACFILAKTAAPAAYAGTSISSITNESIQEKKNQISQSEEAKKQLKQNIANAKALKQELEGLKSDVAAYIKKIDAEIVAIEARIEEYKGLISAKEEEIAVITAELEEAVERENTQYDAMKKRIQFMYKKGDSFYLEIMLSAKSFSDFLTKKEYIEKLEAYDRKMLD